MFGTKFRSWMEAHIVRPRKKQQRNKESNVTNVKCGGGNKHGGGKIPQDRPALDSTGNSPNRCVGAISPSRGNKSQVAYQENHVRAVSPLQPDGNAAHQRYSAAASGNTCNNNKGISLHPNYSPCGGATAAKGENNAGSVSHTGTSLSSPESAYSTGYSTDGTSPGASFPPEYYINIRTGTHYFQSPGGQVGNHRTDVANTALVPAELPPRSVGGDVHHKQVGFQLGDEEVDATRCPTPKKSDLSANYQTHRRTESFDENRRFPASIRTSFILVEDTEHLSLPNAILNISTQLQIPVSSVSTNQNASPSPRQRSRIRTNPWVSTSNVGTNSSSSSCSAFTTKQNGDGFCNISTSSSGIKSNVEQSNSSHGSGSDRGTGSVKNINGAQQKTRICSNGSNDKTALDNNSVTKSPRRTWLSPRSDRTSHSNSPRNRKNSISSSSSSPSRASQKQIRSVPGSDEDDVTLNEMMGKFDESYVYEKETDILSDSDPTDCEDYNDTDVDTGQDGGDERDPLDDDDDFDFIDNGSFLELDQSDNELSARKVNTGHCTYYNFQTDLSRKSTRHRASFLRRSRRQGSKEECSGASSRRSSVRNGGNGAGKLRRKNQENPGQTPKQNSDRRRRRSSNRKSTDNCNEKTEMNGNVPQKTNINLNKVMMDKMMKRAATQGSRSVGGTPVCLRRKHLENICEHDNKNSSASKLILREDTNMLNGNMLNETTNILECTVKKRSNSVSFTAEYRKSMLGSNYSTSFDSEVALIEADKEADRKYRELIMEAEHILVSMKSTTPVLGSPRRAVTILPTNKRVEHLRHTESLSSDVFSKNRNDDKFQISSKPSSPKFTGSPRFSPKKNHITNFINNNSPELSRRESTCNEPPLLSPRKILVSSPRFQRCVLPQSPQRTPRCPNSPQMARKTLRMYSNDTKDCNNSFPGSPKLQLNDRHFSPPSSPNKMAARSKTSSPILHIDDDSESGENEKCYETLTLSLRRVKESLYSNNSHGNDYSAMENNGVEIRPKYEAITVSSSSDSDVLDNDAKTKNTEDDFCVVPERTSRPPLLTFRSIDMGGSRVADSAYCPQSEPVKRKVYSCSATFDRLQRSLDQTQTQVLRHKSDGEANDEAEGPTRTTLREKVAQLRRERLAVEARAGSTEDRTELLQQQIAQFRRQMLLHTIEGLKRSLEDQSASLQQTYHGRQSEHMIKDV